jgi:hypothetical protein
MTDQPNDDQIHADTHWWVVIEETTGWADSLLPRVTHRRRAGSRSTALAEAQKLAYNYEPSHPKRPRRRQVFRCADGSYLVLVAGGVSEFHFKVTVCELVAEQ